MSRITKATPGRYRYGIGEWYGRLFAAMSPSERRRFAQIQALPKKQRPAMPCPAKGAGATCTKVGGVCSLRLYHEEPKSRTVAVAPGEPGRLVTTCPCRFDERQAIYGWIGQVILECHQPLIVREVGFLERESRSAEMQEDAVTTEDVGRIDNVLVHPDMEPMSWCAVELQAVYFSGPAMTSEFRAIAEQTDDVLPFPEQHRRPDYRSSGPKRLMLQLR